MINYAIFEGNLVDKPVYRVNESGVKNSAWGKIGVYQGKDQQGNDIGSMFVEFTCFGTEADTLNTLANKGDRILISGRFSETSSVGQNGQTYMNKKVVGNAKLLVKNPAATQNVATQSATQYIQPVQQYAQPTQYAQPVQQYAAPTQPVQGQNPWSNM